MNIELHKPVKLPYCTEIDRAVREVETELGKPGRVLLRRVRH